MNRFNPLFSKLTFGAILLFLVSSSAVFGQVTYTITGTLDLVSGSDPLMLNGKTVHAIATLNQTATPTSSSTTATSSTNTYSGVTVTLAGFSCTVPSTPPVTVTLTDNVGAPDTLGIANCDLAGLANVTATATIPDGNMITAVPASIPGTVNLISGNISFLLTGGTTPGSFNLENGTLMATGTPPPSVTPSLTDWTVPSVPVGSTTSASQQVTFATTPNVGAVSFTTSSSVNWITVTPAAGNTSYPITITANPTGLTQPFNSGTVTLNFGQGLTAQILVTLTLTSSSVTLTAPAALTFNYTPGGAAPATQQLAIGANSATPVKAAVTAGSWLSVSPASGTTPANFTVSVNTAGITTSQTGNIQITASGATNSPLNIPVTLTVASTSLTVPTTPLTFNFTTGGSAPAAQAVSITGTAGISFAAAAATTSGGSWLATTPSGTVPSSISVSVSTTGLAAGTYSGTVTVTSTGASGSPSVIPVTLNVTSSGPSIGAVVSGASYDTSGFAPGTIATIFGNLLGPQTGVAFSLNSTGTVNSTLSGVTVTVGGAPAIPLFVQNGQVNIILPYGISTAGQAPVVVQYNNLTSTQFNIPLVAADVQIFTANASGSGPGSMLNQDYSVNTSSNPAAPGSVIQIYGTGGGVLGGPPASLGPAVTAGGVAGDTLSWVSLPYSATVNGENASVLYAGSAPGLVYGVVQFNVQLPADVPSGAQKVVLKVGQSTSQSDVTVFVK